MRTRLLEYITGLFFPRVCAACGNTLMRDEDVVCLTCRYTLPKTGYETFHENPSAQLFYGRAKLNAVTSCFFFSKSGKVQHIIHELKYKGNSEAGVFLGQEIGKSIKEAPDFGKIDCLVPVPLHPKRQRKRGYNQSEMIANGICQVTGIPVAGGNLVRVVNTATQTHKNKEERYENVKNIFAVSNPEQLQGRHVLLIDDVLTTGATLTSCINKLSAIPGITISVATAACAGN